MELPKGCGTPKHWTAATGGFSLAKPGLVVG